jgi:hypothetical protein
MKIILILFLLLQYIKCQNIEMCNTSNCDPNGGICESNICKCKENYTTSTRGNIISVSYQNSLSELNMRFCNYERKRSLYAAIIELFIGFGMGHFYSGRKVFGCLKLILYLLLTCISFCSLAIGIKIAEDHGITNIQLNLISNNEAINPAVKFFFYVCVSIINFIILWQLFDFFMFIFKIYKDGNDISLY